MGLVLLTRGVKSAFYRDLIQYTWFRLLSPTVRNVNSQAP